MSTTSLTIYIVLYLSIALIFSIQSLSAQPNNSSNYIDLIDDYQWKANYNNQVYQNESLLELNVDTTGRENIYKEEFKVYSRAYLPIEINTTKMTSPVLNIEYITSSQVGNASFAVEYRTQNNTDIPWSINLKNTNNTTLKETFSMPGNLTEMPIELRIYIITDEPGIHTIRVTNMTLRNDLQIGNLFPFGITSQLERHR